MPHDQAQAGQPPNHNLARHLARMAALEPGRPALLVPAGREADGSIRYAAHAYRDLEAAGTAVACGLRRRGLARGERVLVLLRPGLEFTATVFALFQVGAVPVLVDPGMGLRGLLRCVRRSRPAALAAVPLAHALSLCCPAAFRGVRLRLTAGRRLCWGGATFAGLAAERPDGSCPAVGAADELAAILFTSGSTGPAKGVRYGHGQLQAQADLLRAHFRIEPGEVDLPMLPVFALFGPALGLTSVVPEMNPSRPATVDPERIVRAVRQCGVTTSFGAPVLWRKIAAWCRERGQVLPTLRRVLVAGAPVPPALLRDLAVVVPHGQVHTPYGATEALPLSSITGAEILAGTAALSERGAGVCVGRALPGIRLRVVEAAGDGSRPDPDQPLPAGWTGEIIAAGPVVSAGYDHLTEATAAARLEGRDGVAWHRMGDAGYLDAEGRLWFCGRLEHRVRVAGGHALPIPCEAIFLAHPAVSRAALVGLGPGPEQEPAMVIEPRAWGAWRSRAARGRLRAELAALAAGNDLTRAIRRFFLYRAFPVDLRHNAKIDRPALARWAAGARPL